MITDLPWTPSDNKHGLCPSDLIGLGTILTSVCLLCVRKLFNVFANSLKAFFQFELLVFLSVIPSQTSHVKALFIQIGVL